MDESIITKLVNDIQNERNKIFIEIKNDTELTKLNTLNQKLGTLDAMLKSVFKYRNIIIKERLTFKI
jgi:hypothetical protein